MFFRVYSSYTLKNTKKGLILTPIEACFFLTVLALIGALIVVIVDVVNCCKIALHERDEKKLEQHFNDFIGPEISIFRRQLLNRKEV